MTMMFKNRGLLLGALGIWYIVHIIQSIYHPGGGYVAVSGNTLVLMFVAGVIVYQFKDKILWSGPLFFVSVVATFSLLSSSVLDAYAAVPAAYMTTYLGLLNPPRNKVLLSGDYSYGLFLYSFTVQQTLWTISSFFHQWFWNFLGAFCFTGIAAIISWWFVEKPILSQKENLKKIESWFVNKHAIALLRLQKKVAGG
jgi:peptidoglycan/LPS O-acetylase OafA/YrhL